MGSQLKMSELWAREFENLDEYKRGREKHK